jgi:hypothetical protein
VIANDKLYADTRYIADYFSKSYGDETISSLM